jgi:hypothetical protein
MADANFGANLQKNVYAGKDAVVGEKNTGSVKHNLLITLDCIGCKLDVNSNSNCKLELRNDQISMDHCNNSVIKGKTNSFQLKYNNNLVLVGDGNEINASHNNNLGLTGYKGSFKLKHNNNTAINGSDHDVVASGNNNIEINGESNKITARENSSLKIFGDHNDLNITGTIDHEIQPSQSPTEEDETGFNSIEFVCHTDSGKHSTQLNSQSSSTVHSTGSCSISISICNTGNSTSSNSSNCRYTTNKGPAYVTKISYSKRCKIAKQMYEIGIFKFSLTEDEEFPDTLTLTIQNSDEFDRKTVEQVKVLPNMIELQASQGEYAETLQIKGDKVEVEKRDSDIYYIYLKTDPSSKEQ